MIVNPIVLTGLPFVGKTTVVRRTFELIDVSVAGFYTRAIYAGDRKVGLSFVSFDGSEVLVASSQKETSIRIGGYFIDLEAMNEFMSLCFRRIGKADLMIADEIGRISLSSNVFRDVLGEHLKNKPSIVTARSTQFCDGHCSKEDATILEVTGDNRDELPSRIDVALRGVSSV